MEPARIEEYGDALADLAFDLAAVADRVGRGLPPATRKQLAGVLRLMNSHYSNRMEGNDTHPLDIERTLAGHVSADPMRRRLERESAAHVRLQADLDYVSVALEVAFSGPGKFWGVMRKAQKGGSIFVGYKHVPKHRLGPSMIIPGRPGEMGGSS